MYRWVYIEGDIVCLFVWIWGDDRLFHVFLVWKLLYFVSSVAGVCPRCPMFSWHLVGIGSDDGSATPLSEPMMAYVTDAYLRHSASMSWYYIHNRFYCVIYITEMYMIFCYLLFDTGLTSLWYDIYDATCVKFIWEIFSMYPFKCFYVGKTIKTNSLHIYSYAIACYLLFIYLFIYPYFYLYIYFHMSIHLLLREWLIKSLYKMPAFVGD